MVCCNGLISGTFVLCRKHTKGIDLQDEVDKGVARFIEEAGKVRSCISEMKQKGLTERMSDHMLMEAGRNRLLPWSHIGKVQKEYQHPTFSDFQQRTSWGLYNAFTLISQQSTPDKQMRALNGFREIVLN